MLKDQYMKKRIINITLYMDIKSYEIAESKLHHPSIKKKLTNAQLTAYGDFIDTIASVIVTTGFKIKREYQSKKDYTYYIDFKGSDEIWEIRFRIADHNSRGNLDKINFNPVSYFRSIKIGEKEEFTSYTEAIKDVRIYLRRIKEAESTLLTSRKQEFRWIKSRRDM